MELTCAPDSALILNTSPRPAFSENTKTVIHQVVVLYLFIIGKLLISWHFFSLGMLSESILFVLFWATPHTPGFHASVL